jgi:hypothetical protein
MVKVEAVVIRERVETVIDAVEDETGHVGVTVVEAIGHGRERGITHEYRSWPRSRTRREAATRRATGWSGRARWRTSCTTGRARAWSRRRWRSR